jgi:hypothetical protein
LKKGVSPASLATSFAMKSANRRGEEEVAAIVSYLAY